MGREGNKNQNLKCRNFHGILVEVQKDNKKSLGYAGAFLLQCTCNIHIFCYTYVR